jgi:recombination protein RecA
MVKKDNAFEAIAKKYGENTVRLLSDEVCLGIPVIPTGSYQLDLALGVGGIPTGRIVEIYGPEASGKTTLCLSIIAQCQKFGGTAAFVDVEHAIDPLWAQTCGVDLSKMYLSQPDNGEMAMDIIRMLLDSPVDLIVLDSVAGLVPRAELEGEPGDSHMALVARLMSQSLRMLAGQVKVNDKVLLFTNQLRAKIGSMGYGPQEVTTGGNALKYWCSMRLDVRRTGAVEEKGEVVGSTAKITVKKNKVAAPLKVVNLTILANEGISTTTELIDYAVEVGFIEKKGAGWFTILPETEEVKVQSMENVRKYLIENPTVARQIENKLRITHGLPLIGGILS